MDAIDPAGPAFAVVRDVAASWTDYQAIRSALAESAVPGLILHAAGPTDDGYRTIDVWVSEAASEGFGARLGDVFDRLAAPPVLRELRVVHLFSALDLIE